MYYATAAFLGIIYPSLSGGTKTAIKQFLRLMNTCIQRNGHPTSVQEAAAVNIVTTIESIDFYIECILAVTLK